MKFLKQTAAVLAGSLLAGSCITPAAVSAKDAVPAGIREYGDVNGDNSVDVADAVLTARYVAADPNATVTDMGRSCADVNLDGNVDGTDVTLLATYVKAGGLNVKIVPYSGDVSGDENVDGTDVTLLATFVKANGLNVVIH